MHAARTLDDRAVRLFIVLAAVFCANAVLAEFIGVKIFALEDTLGVAPLEWNLFGQTGSLSFTAGTLLWPFVFILTDTVNEYFGKRGVRLISWLAAGFIVYGFVFAFVAIYLAPASWWIGVARDQGVPDYQAAFAAVFGQGLWTICGSLVAFIVGQLIDVHVFHRIRRATADDEAHRLVDGPVGRRDLFHRHDLEVTGGRVRRGRYVDRGQLAAGARLADDPGDEAEGLHLRVREVDQDHALGPVRLGLQDVEQFACAAIDRAGQRDPRHHRFEPAEQALADDPTRQPADQQDRQYRRDQRERVLHPRIAQPAQRLRAARSDALQAGTDQGLAEIAQQHEQELHHDPRQPKREQGEQAGQEQALQAVAERGGSRHARILGVHVVVAECQSMRTRRMPTSS